MALETGTYISDLVITNPTGADAKSTSDDHHRLIKSTIKATFPNISGAVLPTHTELNYVDGVTSAIQTQIDNKAALASPTFTGTPAAPTAAAATNSTQLATTAFVQSAIAGVNAQTPITVVHITASTGTVNSGQLAYLDNVAATSMTLGTIADQGEFGVVTANGLSTNTLDIGAKTLYGPAGSITGVITLDGQARVWKFKYTAATTSLEII